jgi:DNA replication and repair protein RecF
MQAVHLTARRFRNLADQDLELPPDGAVFLGPNGQGKTNLLEALYYPVLFRSFRGAVDVDVCRWDGPGFHMSLAAGGPARTFEASFQRTGRRKRIAVDGVDMPRVADAVGRWLAVAFLPTDLQLVQGPAAGRRQYVDRVLALADPAYLHALLRYRAVLAQRNAALRGGRADLASAFDDGLAGPGARVVRARLAWVDATAARYAAESDALGEPVPADLGYRGNVALAEAEAWPEALRDAAGRDQARGMTTVGPHRDDLALSLNGRSLREFGSAGQQRTAAVALKLCELATLAEARGTEPALLLDDVFAELDRERQERLAGRLGVPGARQVFLTAPRRDELPPALDLEVFEVTDGAARVRARSAAA